MICGLILSSLDKTKIKILYPYFFQFGEIEIVPSVKKNYKYFFLNIKQSTNIKFIFLLLGPYLSLVPSK